MAEPKPAKAKAPTQIIRKTIDGREIQIIGQLEIKRLAGKAVCVGGKAIECHKGGVHKFTMAHRYDDPSRGLIGIGIDREISRGSYWCKKCGAFMGCSSCIEDIATMTCSMCRDWANDLSLRVHGKMIVNGSQLSAESWNLIQMRERRQLDDEQAGRLFSELFKGEQ